MDENLLDRVLKDKSDAPLTLDELKQFLKIKLQYNKNLYKLNMNRGKDGLTVLIDDKEMHYKMEDIKEFNKIGQKIDYIEYGLIKQMMMKKEKREIKLTTNISIISSAEFRNFFKTANIPKETKDHLKCLMWGITSRRTLMSFFPYYIRHNNLQLEYQKTSMRLDVPMRTAFKKVFENIYDVNPKVKGERFKESCINREVDNGTEKVNGVINYTGLHNLISAIVVPFERCPRKDRLLFFYIILTGVKPKADDENGRVQELKDKFKSHTLEQIEEMATLKLREKITEEYRYLHNENVKNRTSVV